MRPHLVRLLVGLGLRFAKDDLSRHRQSGRDDEVALSVFVRPRRTDPSPCQISAIAVTANASCVGFRFSAMSFSFHARSPRTDVALRDSSRNSGEAGWRGKGDHPQTMEWLKSVES